MKHDKDELIKLYFDRAEESLSVARICVEKQYWNAAASSSYYTVFHLIQALFAKHEIKTNTHSGVQRIFNSKFIREEVFDVQWGRLLSKAFKYRQEGDYGDFRQLDGNVLIPLLSEVEQFRSIILQELQTL